VKTWIHWPFTLTGVAIGFGCFLLSHQLSLETGQWGPAWFKSSWSWVDKLELKEYFGLDFKSDFSLPYSCFNLNIGKSLECHVGLSTNFTGKRLPVLVSSLIWLERPKERFNWFVTIRPTGRFQQQTTCHSNNSQLNNHNFKLKAKNNNESHCQKNNFFVMQKLCKVKIQVLNEEHTVNTVYISPSLSQTRSVHVAVFVYDHDKSLLLSSSYSFKVVNRWT
jgi:hypothetical protein